MEDLGNIKEYSWNDEIILKEIKKVTNMSDIFEGYYGTSFIDFPNWDTSTVTDMSGMFYCQNLRYLPDISKWDTSDVIDMNGIFYCKDLRYLPDISKWNTSYVTNMNNILLFIFWNPYLIYRIGIS